MKPILLLLSLLSLFLGKGANAFQAASPDHHRRLHPHRPLLLLSTTSTQLYAAPAKRVHILPTEDEVTNAVHQIVESCAKKAIASRGNFALAIPGGSVLKVLSSLDPTSDWVSKTTLCFVNHKCVDITDVSSAIEAQARSKFLDRWGLTDIISLGGTSDGKKEAEAYEAKMKDISEEKLPRDDDGFPIFDLMLVGVGDDGHIGSLYPNRIEIDIVSGPWVTPAFQKDPPSISLTLPVMQRAQTTVISAAGKSPKYPNGKASAMRLAIADGGVTPKDFPASALRESAVWILDEPNGSEMSELFELSSVEKAVADI
jgi:6-phosphogluconolactonase